ncbi:MAG: hypothetical protein R3C68_02750 [Myxococcota bacterium]
MVFSYGERRGANRGVPYRGGLQLAARVLQVEKNYAWLFEDRQELDNALSVRGLLLPVRAEGPGAQGLEQLRRRGCGDAT